MTTSRQLPLITPPGPVRNAAVGSVRLLLFNAQHAAPGGGGANEKGPAVRGLSFERYY
jgi:hypothetical protein